MSSAGRKKVTAGQIVLVIAFSIICLSVLVPVINLVARSFASSKGALEMRGFPLKWRFLSQFSPRIVWR